jgi:hypothetical protein
MQQPLPTGGFRWMDSSEFDAFIERLPTIPVDNPEGFVLEVDLEYPPELHDLHNDYPLAPDRLRVTADMLSDYCRSFFANKPYMPDEKLIPNLMDKKKYVVHYRNLQLYMSLGMRVTLVHRILSFRQERWLAPYIELNTSMRQKATSEFERDFYKLANNSVYGE